MTCDTSMQFDPRVTQDYYEQCADGLSAIDLELRYVSWNRSLEKITGMSAQEALGKKVFDLFPFLRDLDEAKIHRRVFSGETVVAEPRPYKVPEKNRYGYFQGQYSPWRNEKGEIIGLFMSIRDVGPKLNELLYLRDVSDQLAKAKNTEEILSITVKAITGFLNTRALFLMSLVEDEPSLQVIGHDGFPEDLMVPSRRIPLDSVWPSAIAVREAKPIIVPSLEDAEKNFNVTVRRAMEAACGQAFVAVPWIVEGKPIGSVGACFTTSLEVNTESVGFLQTLSAQCAQAYDRARMYQLEREARAQAEEANRSKTRFLATISHEIRTPLTVVLGYAELLQSACAAMRTKIEKSDRIVSYLDGIVRNSRSMGRLIEDLLDLSKIESNRMRIRNEAIDTRAWASEIAASGTQLASAKNLEFKLEIQDGAPSSFESDPQRIKQIVMNLITNSVKFTKEGWIRLCIAKGPEDTIEFTVEDTGTGVSRNIVDLLESSSAKQGEEGQERGHGLGLAIASRLARALGGRLRLSKTERNQGSTFQLSLPYKAPQVRPPAFEGAHPHLPCLQGLRILVAEDDEDLSQVLRSILSQEGAQVQLAKDGAEAIEFALSEEFDVFLLDLQMPRINGYEAATELRNSAIMKPIIALTAHALHDYRDRAAKAGFDAFIAKPVDRQTLCEAIMRLSQS